MPAEGNGRKGGGRGMKDLHKDIESQARQKDMAQHTGQLDTGEEKESELTREAREEWPRRRERERIEDGRLMRRRWRKRE